jgi:hypothetical protein
MPATYLSVAAGTVIFNGISLLPASPMTPYPFFARSSMAPPVTGDPDIPRMRWGGPAPANVHIASCPDLPIFVYPDMDGARWSRFDDYRNCRANFYVDLCRDIDCKRQNDHQKDDYFERKFFHI